MKNYIQSIYFWIDAEAKSSHNVLKNKNISTWLRCMPFIVTHLACLAIFVVGYSKAAIIVFVISYLICMFAITGFYHRYFSHRAFKTSRTMQFIFAVLGLFAAQRGPLWWAAHHRHHHKYSDLIQDKHSPKQHGFIWSHFGWFTTNENFVTDHAVIKDLIRYPELKFLNRFDSLLPLVYGLFMFILGNTLQRHGVQTSGLQILIWGYFISTVILYHATFSINSLAHIYGTRRFVTKDNSRNNWWLAILTLGEGWHNNHHYWPSSARQGFHLSQIDITYYGLKLLEKLGLIWDLRLPPAEVLNAKTIK